MALTEEQKKRLEKFNRDNSNRNPIKNDVDRIKKELEEKGYKQATNKGGTVQEDVVNKATEEINKAYDNVNNVLNNLDKFKELDNKNRNPIKGPKEVEIPETYKKANVNNDLQEVYNQTFGERLVKGGQSIVTDLASVPFQAFDIAKEAYAKGELGDAVKKYIPTLDTFSNALDFTSYLANQIDPNLKEFKATDEDNLSYKLNQKAEELHNQALLGTEGLENVALNTLIGAGNMASHLGIAYATGGAINPVLTMAVQSGTDKTYQNLQEGYDMETSLGNGLLTGAVTAITEKLGLDRLIKIATSGLGQFALSAYVTNCLSESFEEGIEYTTGYLLDKAMLGKEEDYNTGELFMSMLYGFTVSGLMTGGAEIKYHVDTKKTYNQLKADMETLVEYQQTNELTEEENSVINTVLNTAQQALNKFDSTSVLGNAVNFESDQVTRTSAQEIIDNYNKFTQPDVDKNNKFAEQQNTVKNVLENSQKVLSQKGINMDVVQYSNLDNETKAQVDKVQGYANDLGVKVVFDTNMDATGMYYDGRVYINPTSELAPLTTFVHELTHGVESSQWYTPLKQVILNSKDSLQLSKDVKYIKDRYQASGIELDDEGAMQEYIAIQTQEMLNNEEFVERLVRYNNSLATRIYEGIKHIVAKTDTMQDIEYNFMKAFKNNGIDTNALSTQYSVSTNVDSEGRTLSKEQQEYFKDSKMRDDNGNLKPFYHGTPRADRVGNYFDPDKATSGPMAYFTDNKTIANNYARDKKDTSIAYDERYDSPETQFRINRNGKDIPVGDLWNSMTYREKVEFKKKAQQLTMNWDNEDEVELMFEEGNRYGIGNLSDYEIRDKNGNVINALIHSWVTEGNLWKQEHKFLDVLKAMGIEDAYYLDPDYRDEKTYEVYLNITNPFNTSDVDEMFVEELEKFMENNDISQYQKESQHADTWDKNSVDMDDWIWKLNDDIKNGTAHVWTSIPDVVTAFLKSNNYDGILDVGGKRGGDLHQVAIPFYSNQIKNVTNTNPTEEKDIRYSIGLTDEDLSKGLEAHDQALDQYGAFEEGEIPVRNVEIAQETDYGKTNRFARTIAESGSVTDEQTDLLKAQIGKGEFAYQPISNEKLKEMAQFKIAKLGEEKAIENFLEGEGYSSETIALGELLLDKVAKSGNDELSMKIASKLAMQLTEAGRAVQAARLLKRLTPQGQLVYLERTIDKLQKSLNTRYGKKAPQVEVSDELKSKLLNTQNEEEMNKVLEEISANIAQQIPSTLMDKLNAWRYLAMLGNPRTHVRNTMGNLMFYPMVTIKNGVGAVLEAVAQKSGKLDSRTKTILNPFDAKDKVLLDFAEKNFEEYKQTFKSGKYDIKELIEANRDVYSNDNVFGKTLNKLMKANSGALEWEDVFFSRLRYRSSLAQYMKANKLTPDDVDSKEFIKAQEYAYKEAKKQTYQDQNAIASAIEKFAKTNRGTQLAVDAIMPFKKTPMNVLSRGVEYSPIGLIASATKGSMDLKNGKITANEFIDKLSAGLTGTGVTLLGAFLAYMGWFRTRDEDKDRKQYYDEDLGEQDYALVFPHGTYTIDWASPMIMPLAIGAELIGGIDNFESFDDLVTIASKISEPIFETSMLSGLTSTLQSYASGSAGAFNMIQNSIASYVNQYIPTLFGQIARSIDDTRRTTYPNDGVIDKTAKQIQNKIPGLSFNSEPYINKKGEEQKQEGNNFFTRAMLNMLSPGYYKSNTTDEYDEELLRLYGIGNDADALPSSSTKSVTYENNKYELKDEAYTNFHETRYTIEREDVNKFIDSDEYDALDDSTRISIIGKIREYAGKEAKAQYLKSIGVEFVDSSYEKTQGALESGLSLYEYFLSKNYYNALSGKDKKDQYVDYLLNTGYSTEAISYLYDLEYTKGDITDYAPSSDDVTLEEMYAKTFGSSKGTSGNKKKSTKNDSVFTGDLDKDKAIIDNMIAKAYSSGNSNDAYERVNTIIKNLSKTLENIGMKQSDFSKIIKKYLEDHPYDSTLFS